MHNNISGVSCGDVYTGYLAGEETEMEAQLNLRAGAATSGAPCHFTRKVFLAHCCDGQLKEDMHFVWFFMRDRFFSPQVSASLPSCLRGWDSETSVEKSISYGKPCKMHFLAYFTFQVMLIMFITTLHKVEDHESHVRWISLLPMYELHS